MNSHAHWIGSQAKLFSLVPPALVLAALLSWQSVPGAVASGGDLDQAGAAGRHLDQTGAAGTAEGNVVDVIVEPVIDPEPEPLLGDVDGDGSVDFFDFDPLMLAILDPAAYQVAYPRGSLESADINQDGAVDWWDMEDFTDYLLSR